MQAEACKQTGHAEKLTCVTNSEAAHQVCLQLTADSSGAAVSTARQDTSCCAQELQQQQAVSPYAASRVLGSAQACNIGWLRI